MENVTSLSARDLIWHIGTKRAEWGDLPRQVPAGQMNQPVLYGWTVRDAIAILTRTERRLTEIIRTRAVTGVSFGELPEAEQAHILEASSALPQANSPSPSRFGGRA